jgi:uncharacterized membrane protein
MTHRTRNNSRSVLYFPFRLMISGLLVTCAVALFCCSTTAVYAQATFTPLGTFGATRSVAQDVSADGSVVVGTVVDAINNRTSVFRWTRQGSELRPSSNEHAAISADGSVVVGTYSGPNGVEAFRWMADGTFHGLGDLPGGLFSSAAFDVSADGSVIVGVSSTVFDGETVGQAFRWTAQGRMVGLNIGRPNSRATATSADGGIVVGTSDVNTFIGFHHNVEDGVTQLVFLPGRFSDSVHAVSADGVTVVGSSLFRVGLSGFRDEAFRWTERDGAVSLSPAHVAYDVSADGSVIVGQSPVHGAFYWTKETGMLSLQEVLVSLGVSNLDGWQLGSAEGVSPDGRTIVGVGNHNGRGEAWIATIPEPSSLVFAASGAGALWCFYRRGTHRRHVKSAWSRS